MCCGCCSAAPDGCEQAGTDSTENMFLSCCCCCSRTVLKICCLRRVTVLDEIHVNVAAGQENLEKPSVFDVIRDMRA